MDRSSDDLDRQLGEWLREEATARASVGLVEAVFARTSRTRQARRPWSLSRNSMRWFTRPVPALAGAVAVAIVAAVGVSVLQPPTGPAAVSSS